MKQVLDAIDRALNVFGSSVRYAIYYHISKGTGLELQELASEPEKFVKGLETVFGDGAQMLERLIIQEINSEFKIRAVTLTDALMQARVKLLEGKFDSAISAKIKPRRTA